MDVDWSKLVRKNYDYIYTGENVDVQNLRDKLQDGLLHEECEG